MRYRIECGKYGTYIYDELESHPITLQEVVARLNSVIDDDDNCPECGKQYGEGAAEWCYSCCLYKGLIGH